MTARLPNFVYLGPSKAGSTWLHEVLIKHPQVFMTEAKDLYFFDRYFDRGTDWYAGHFRRARPEQTVVGEVCQEYLSSPEAPARMHQTLGDNLRLMVTLREPVARAFSGYLYMRKHGVFTGTFREALDTRPGMFEHNRYATLLSRFLEYFDRRRLHVGVFDDLVEDPQLFIDEVVKFLEIDRAVLDESLLVARLPASRARSTGVASAVKRGANWARQRRSAAIMIGRVKRSPLVHKLLYTPLTERPEPSAEEAAYMRERLGPEMERLEEIVGLELRKRWGWPH
ncbi:MAG: sulfotransferase domain-containing protein [Actinomycetota bacterium]|nr:sulfotransferase domain-containing protein [Actinomycetota bacterium]